MSESLYREHILQHYKEPHNFGAVADADAEAEVANATCGDELHFTVSVEDGKITDIKFDGSGCALSVAAASMLTDELQDESLESVKSISDEDVFDLVGLEKENISPMRMKCVLLPKKGAQKLIKED